MGRTLVLLLVVAACRSKPPQNPKQDQQVAELQKELDDTKAQLVKAQGEAEDLRKSDAAKADEASALEKKLADAVGKAGEVTTADGAVRLELVDQILFPVGEADLTDKGKEVLAKVGAALKEIDNKQIWVQGHTDDQPIIMRKPKPKPAEAKPAAPEPPPKKGAKNAKDKKPEPAAAPAPPPPAAEEKHVDAVLPFVTNWELSAARALTVVHYLQDQAKIDPTRLAAVAFSQYRPVSKNRAKNRRIEIVLYPRAKISPK